jgi:hypothetical protein
MSRRFWQVVNDRSAATRMQQAASDIEDTLAREQLDTGTNLTVFQKCIALDASREDVGAAVCCSLLLPPATPFCRHRHRHRHRRRRRRRCCCCCCCCCCYYYYYCFFSLLLRCVRL